MLLLVPPQLRLTGVLFFPFQPLEGQVRGQPIASLASGEGGLAALICEKLWPSLASDPGEASLVSDPGEAASSGAVGSQDQSHPCRTLAHMAGNKSVRPPR